jgi:hypothetical protein
MKDDDRRPVSEATGLANRNARRLILALIVAGVVVAAIGAFLFDRGAPDSLSRELGSALLQLGMIGVGGAAIGWFIDDQRERASAADDRQREATRAAEEDRERRLDILARIRAAHVRVAYAARLINAHDTPKTYFERCRDLMMVRHELDEISTEIDVGRNLFEDPDSIRSGIELMIIFLDSLADEYQKCKPILDSNYARQGKPLSAAIAELRLTGVDDLRSGTGSFTKYEDGLSLAKGAIRLQVLSPDRA